MPTIIKDCHIENCRTGIKAEGHVDLNISGMTFVNNGRDIDLEVDSESNITIERISSINCKTESITYKEYLHKISNIINQINNLELKKHDKQLIISKLQSMEKCKDKPVLLKKCLCELYDISKGIGLPLLVQFICKTLGWI